MYKHCRNLESSMELVLGPIGNLIDFNAKDVY